MRDLNARIAVIERALLSQNQKLVLAESCTGGLLAELLTNIPGSSRWFYGSFVTYHPKAKTEMLGIPQSRLTAEGLVSEYTALAMAKESLARSGADFSISLTGVAGPDGDGSTARVGELWVAWGDKTNGYFKAKHFEGVAQDRETFRREACGVALEGLATYLDCNSSRKEE